MLPKQFKFRAINFEHSCLYEDGREPTHPSKLRDSIKDIIEATQELSFLGTIKSPKNNYQMISDFDLHWISATNNMGWEAQDIQTIEGGEAANIKPDAILSKDRIQVVVEIEKANKKTIWFDFMKIMMYIGAGITDFGLLIVPSNYAHKNGVWKLFDEARYYRWCLQEYAKVNAELLSKIAIIGYTQEVDLYNNNRWVECDNNTVRTVKELAHYHFAH